MTRATHSQDRQPPTRLSADETVLFLAEALDDYTDAVEQRLRRYSFGISIAAFTLIVSLLAGLGWGATWLFADPRTPVGWVALTSLAVLLSALVWVSVQKPGLRVYVTQLRQVYSFASRVEEFAELDVVTSFTIQLKLARARHFLNEGVKRVAETDDVILPATMEEDGVISPAPSRSEPGKSRAARLDDDETATFGATA